MKKLNYSKVFVVLLLIVIAIMLIMFFMQINSLKQEMEFKNDRIEMLSEKNKEYENQILELKKEMSKLEFSINPKVEYNENEFNYLALGNSITWHDKCEYWWNEIGMAASKPENDYFHIVTRYLNENKGKTNAYAFKYSDWELQSADRAGSYSLLKSYLSPDLDLVSIQLSENATELTTFERDLVELIEHVRTKCPEAQIILIDDFWSDKKSDIKRRVALNSNVDFVDLTEIREDTDYQSELGATVYGDDGQEHIIDHNGVATHPGDKGMQYIADKVIEYIK